MNANLMAGLLFPLKIECRGSLAGFLKLSGEPSAWQKKRREVYNYFLLLSAEVKNGQLKQAGHEHI